jgi:hypothetical protein
VHPAKPHQRANPDGCTLTARPRWWMGTPQPGQLEAAQGNKWNDTLIIRPGRWGQTQRRNAVAGRGGRSRDGRRADRDGRSLLIDLLKIIVLYYSPLSYNGGCGLS